MKYDTFISYSINDSSIAYDLSAKLEKENIRCYLDCIESGMISNDYTKRLINECDLYAVIANKTFEKSDYAIASLQYAMSQGKQVVVMTTEETQLPESQATFPSYTTKEGLIAGIEHTLKNTQPASVEHTTPDEEVKPTIVPKEDNNLHTEATTVQPTAEGEVEINTEKSEEKPAIPIDDQGPAPTPQKPQYTEHRGPEPNLETDKRDSELGCGVAIGLTIFTCIVLGQFKSCLDERRHIINDNIELVVSNAQKAQQINEEGDHYLNHDSKHEYIWDNALLFHLEAAEMGEVNAMYQVGMFFRHKKETRHISANWLFRAAKGGNGKAFSELKKMAEEGHAIAQVHLGTCYFYGYCTPKSARMAAAWFEHASNRGNAQGHFNLGRCYHHGKGVIKHRHKALKLYREAEKLGHKEAAKAAEKLERRLDSDD